MAANRFPVSGKVEIFHVKKPWIYVRVPLEHTITLKDAEDRGLVPIAVTLGRTTWATSLMPMGDGSSFIPLNVKVRKSENIEVGENVDLFFVLRERGTG